MWGESEVTSISERRTDRMLDAARSRGLPPFLAFDPGVDSGHMIAQYTAAGIVAELKRLAVPASVDSIPSSAMQEDHVSMGWAAARKLRRAVDGLGRVVAIELVTAEGEIVRADRRHHSDLFWAVRGGGGAFGIVTHLEFELLQVGDIQAGGLWYPVERASDVLPSPGGPQKSKCSSESSRCRAAPMRISSFSLIRACPTNWSSNAGRSVISSRGSPRNSSETRLPVPRFGRSRSLASISRSSEAIVILPTILSASVW